MPESVLVVGGGIVGLSIAARLVLDGKNVTVVDCDGLMKGVSYGNAGYLSEANLFPPAAPDMLKLLPRLLLSSTGPLVIRPSYLHKMLPWGIHALAAARKHRRDGVIGAMGNLIRPAVAAIQDLASATGAGRLVSRAGGLVAFRTPEALNQRAASVPLWREQGVAVETITREAVLELEPHITPDIHGGLLFPDAGRCSDPQKLGLQYARFIAENGGIFIQGRVHRVDATDRAVTLALDDQSLSADKAILAAGLGTRKLIEGFALPCPMISERGYHMMLPESAGLLNRPVVFGEPFFAATPMDAGLRLAGTAEFAAPQRAPDMKRAYMLLALSKAYLPTVQSHNAEPWMGCRPSLPDGMPAIGSLFPHGRILYAFGHGHNGLTTSAITAECISALVNNVAPPVELAPFRIERFGRQG